MREELNELLRDLYLYLECEATRLRAEQESIMELIVSLGMETTEKEDRDAYKNLKRNLLDEACIENFQRRILEETGGRSREAK